ncbi:MAG: hypothetical protein AB1556_09030 [Bacillota bacterium]
MRQPAGAFDPTSQKTAIQVKLTWNSALLSWQKERTKGSHRKKDVPVMPAVFADGRKRRGQFFGKGNLAEGI